MKDIAIFRKDLQRQMDAHGVTQSSLARISGVDQASLSRFLRHKNPEGLSGESVLRLYGFVYPSDAADNPPPPPAEASPEVRS